MLSLLRTITPSATAVANFVVAAQPGTGRGKIERPPDGCCRPRWGAARR